MSPVAKFTRAVTDAKVARIGDPELAGALAAERAVADAELAAAKNLPTAETRTIATKAELMKLLAIRSPRTIEAMVKSGSIPDTAIVRAGRLVRFDVARVLEALRGAPKAEGRGAAWARARGALRVVGAES